MEQPQASVKLCIKFFLKLLIAFHTLSQQHIAAYFPIWVFLLDLVGKVFLFQCCARFVYIFLSKLLHFSCIFSYTVPNKISMVSIQILFLGFLNTLILFFPPILLIVFFAWTLDAIKCSFFAFPTFLVAEFVYLGNCWWSYKEHFVLFFH